MIGLHLFIEFFKIGLFSVGGGYATLPFLYRLIDVYGWYSTVDLTNMIAISLLTPGPVGVNMATFAGFKTMGIFGGVLATFSIVLPSYLIVIFVSKLLKTSSESIWTKSILHTLKPAGCALLTAVGINLFKTSITSIPALIIILILFGVSFKFKKNPLYYFVFAIFIAMIFKIFNII